jgi:hypothetical protein
MSSGRVAPEIRRFFLPIRLERKQYWDSSAILRSLDHRKFGLEVASKFPWPAALMQDRLLPIMDTSFEARVCSRGLV